MAQIIFMLFALQQCTDDADWEVAGLKDDIIKRVPVVVSYNTETQKCDQFT